MPGALGGAAAAGAGGRVFREGGCCRGKVQVGGALVDGQGHLGSGALVGGGNLFGHVGVEGRLGAGGVGGAGALVGDRGHFGVERGASRSLGLQGRVG